MDNNIDTIINSTLEKIAQGYAVVKRDWLADKRNLFKDGRLLGYYEAKEAFLNCLNNGDSLNNAIETLAALYHRAKTEWLADKKNPFKDGKFLACYEILTMLPSAA